MKMSETGIKVTIELDYDKGLVVFAFAKEGEEVFDRAKWHYLDQRDKVIEYENRYDEHISQDDKVALVYFYKDMAEKKLLEEIKESIKELGCDVVKGILNNIVETIGPDNIGMMDSMMLAILDDWILNRK